MKNYNTKADAVIGLQESGYDKNFIFKNEGLRCIRQHEKINPDGFEITERRRFEDKPRLNDNFIINAIRSLNHDARGILMTSNSALTRGMSIHLWSKLSIELQKGQSIFSGSINAQSKTA
jgi:hypothetical protein